jgi:two-component system phosphate regulon sensor histidine kinase PhoR
VAPIEKMADNIVLLEENDVYDEMKPFVATIKQQHVDILKHSQMRQEFTANVSHELKTPLTAISGYAELIASGMTSGEDTIHFATEIHKSAERLQYLINDIIKLSELDATENSTRPMDSVPLYVLAENCVDMLQLHAEKHQVTLDMEGEPCNILGNKEMIEETLYNLCDNAIRYNNPGGTVHVTVRPQGDKVLLKVADTGIGIPKEHQKRIFERFYRTDSSRNSKTGGTGLGLAIAKKIIEDHGGQIYAESEKGKGTKISFSLPKKVDEKKKI